MTNEALAALIAEKKIIAIVRGIYGEDCARLAGALYRGGIRVLEVTFDKKHPEEAAKTAETIRMLTELFGDEMAFGAGTVTSVEHVDLAALSGAQFIVSPDTREDVIRRTKELGLFSIPGAFTPTEIGRAWDLGADLVKLFPAGVAGPAYVRAVLVPWNQIPVLATVGIDETNAASYLEAGAAAVGVGSILARKDLVAAGRFDEIEEAARRLVAAVEKA